MANQMESSAYAKIGKTMVTKYDSREMKQVSIVRLGLARKSNMVRTQGTRNTK